MADDTEIYLADVFAALRRQRGLILISTVIAVVIGLLYSVLSTPYYSSSVKFLPATGQGANSGLSALSGSLGPAAALVGIDLGSGGSGKEEYLAVLRSRELSVRFIEENGVLPHLFPRRWDEQAAQWRPNEPGVLGRLAQGLSKIIARLSGDKGWRAPTAVPSAWQAYDEFRKISAISEDTDTGIVTMTIEFSDPDLASTWANAYIDLANNRIRQDEIEEASRALEHLNEQALQTSVGDLKDKIYELIETQLERIMLANARPQFAFRVVDKAVVPEDHSHPNRPLLAILSLVLGGMLGVFAALAVETYRGSFSARSHPST